MEKITVTVDINSSLENTWETAISFTDKYNLVSKTFPLKERKNRLDVNYIVAAILIFRLGHNNSSALNWTKVSNCKIRSN